mgnify:CR=1 FL=1
MYMCMVLVYFLNLRISIFEEKNVEGNKHRCVNKKTRGNGEIGYRRKLPFRGIWSKRL